MLQDEIKDILKGCKTLEDWRAAAIIIADKAESLEEDMFNMQSIIKEAYGEKALEELIVAVQSLKTPSTEETIELRNQILADYGYTKGDMIGITYEQALERFNFNQPVHMLMQDNTEVTPTTIESMRSHYENGGYFGVTEKEMNELIDELVGIFEEDRE